MWWFWAETVAIICTITQVANASSNFFPKRPPAIPLAVKSPYLNVLQFAGNGGEDKGYLAGQWPRFWAGQIAGWTGMIRVDGATYTWMGAPGPQSVNQTAFKYSSTSSVFISNIDGKVEVEVKFLSPINLDDLKRQSLIFSYLDIAVRSMDGASHVVQLYSDISAEWVSGNHTSVAQWNYGLTDDNIAFYKVYRQTQLLFSEIADQAEWGSWYWATQRINGLTHQSGADGVVRGAFISSGKLENTEDSDFRPINKDWPVFGFSVDLGPVTSVKHTLFTIGLAQEQALQYQKSLGLASLEYEISAEIIVSELHASSGIISLPSLWKSYFASETSATASSIASKLDNKISADSIAAGGQDYLTITSLSARQAIGGTQLVGTSDKQFLIMKEISSDGNIQTVDVIFPFYPMLIYLQPSLAKLMLDPLFEIQESGLYPVKSAMHDIGSRFPNATGHSDGRDEPQPLEECGNMLIMTLAYAQRTNDISYLSQHYQILKQWTEYLVQEALIPANQISTDDFAGSLANQTNLALKGIIGIQAMAVISNLTGHNGEGANYTSIANDYIVKWQGYAIAHDDMPPHTTLAYGKNDTHGLLYNLYADSLLKLNIVPRSIFEMQSAFYPTVRRKYGVPLDTRHDYTKSDWEIWTAAISNSETKSMFIADLANWIGETSASLGFPDIFDTVSGDRITSIAFASRPVVGGHFALLALDA